MNERIKELAREAGFIVDVSANADRQIQQLTEAIVRECADWLSKREFASPEALKQHFGVE